MENFQECKELSIELMQTVDEGIVYIVQMFESQNFEAGYRMIYDVAQAVYVINNALKSMDGISDSDSAEFRLERIQNILNDILFKFKEEEQNKIIDYFNKVFALEYAEWRKMAFELLNHSQINN